MSKFVKGAKRMNKSKHKFCFTIHIKNLVHPPTEAVLEGAPISVAFQRGPKLAITKETKLGSGGCVFDENLSLLVTLYKGKTGFQEKKGKLWVRQTKTSKNNSEIHQGIGICEFDLAQYVGVGQKGEDVHFDLSMASTDKATIYCNISSTTVASSTDETLSTFSGMSSVSAQGAVFDHEGFTSSSTMNDFQNESLQAISERTDMDSLLQEIDQLDPEKGAVGHSGSASGGSASMEKEVLMWKKKFAEEVRYQRGIETQLINAKLEVAELKTAMDQKHKECMDLKKIVAKYASEIGKMEVKQSARRSSKRW